MTVSLLFVVLGSFLDAAAMRLVLVPTVQALGIDPGCFGVVVVPNVTIGLVPPPYGLLLFALSALAKIPLGEIAGGTLALIGALIAAPALLVAFAGLGLWLPQALGYGAR